VHSCKQTLFTEDRACSLQVEAQMRHSARCSHTTAHDGLKRLGWEAIFCQAHALQPQSSTTLSALCMASSLTFHDTLPHFSRGIWACGGCAGRAPRPLARHHNDRSPRADCNNTKCPLRLPPATRRRAICATCPHRPLQRARGARKPAGLSHQSSRGRRTALDAGATDVTWRGHCSNDAPPTASLKRRTPARTKRWHVSGAPPPSPLS